MSTTPHQVVAKRNVTAARREDLGCIIEELAVRQRRAGSEKN